MPARSPTIDAKLVRAAALAHKATGLPVAVAHRQRRCRLRGARPRRRGRRPAVSVHLGSRAERTGRVAARTRRGTRAHGSSSTGSARRASTSTSRSCCRCKPQGAWIACWFRTMRAGITSASPTAAGFAPFDTLFTKFVPALKAAGVSEANVRQLLVDNPRRALTGQT